MTTRQQVLGAIGAAIRSRRISRSTLELFRDDVFDSVAAVLGRSPVEGPRGDSAQAPPFPIDVVYTWVDHSDPEWLASVADFGERHGDRDDDADVMHPSRFENHDELRFSMRSIHRYIGWVRTIHIVTAGSTPGWLADHPRVRIVRHEEILPDDALPTFNSHAIEARLHHIDGLSESFIYLNDDFFFARPQTYRRYFSESGRPQVPIGDGPVGAVPRSSPGMYAASHRTAEIVMQSTGEPADRLLLHAPYPQSRALTSDLERLLPETFSETVSHRKRHVDDVSVPASLAPWYGVATDRADIATVDCEYVSVGHPTTGSRLRRLRRRRLVDSFCLNWTERTGPDWGDRIVAFLHRRYPDAAPWERTE